MTQPYLEEPFTASTLGVDPQFMIHSTHVYFHTGRCLQLQVSSRSVLHDMRGVAPDEHLLHRPIARWQNDGNTSCEEGGFV